MCLVEAGIKGEATILSDLAILESNFISANSQGLEALLLRIMSCEKFQNLLEE